MADVDIELTLQGGEVGDGGRRYEPGSTVQGWARLTPVGTVDCRRVVVRLEWHTEGRGDRDQGCADEVELASGPLSGPLVQSFTLTVPQMPWTYAGDYINIIWRVLVVVDIRLAFDIRAEAPIVAAPRRAGRLPPVPPRTNVPPDALPDGRESPSPSSGSPPPPDSTGQEDVLGLRIAAALIDLVLLSGLFVIMGVTVGETSTTGGFYVSLNGWWLVAFVALALLYYFILEAVSGQTVGKRVLGLRVSRAGERAPVGAVAVRTMLRVVDGLPVLYLVGFITMMATGARRQRVGDLAAGTSVVRTPVRHRGLALVALAVVVLAAAGLSVYRVNSPEGPHTYRAHGVSFKYPARWHIGGAETTARAGGAEVLWETAVGPSTKWDVIEVDAYRVNRPVTAQNIDAVIPEVESVTRQLFDQLGGAVQAGPEKITMAGLPAVRFRGTGTLDGSLVESIVVVAFSGTTEYSVNCQHTAARAAEVERACNQVVGSFQLRGGTNNASTNTVPTPTTSVTQTVQAPPASEPSSPPATTPETLQIGQAATVTMDGTDAAKLMVVSVKASTRPADEYGSPPQHRYFLTVEVRATALPSNSNGFDIGAIDFYALLGGSHFESDNGNALDAPGADNELYATLNAGESTSGTVVFDVPSKHGKSLTHLSTKAAQSPTGRSSPRQFTATAPIGYRAKARRRRHRPCRMRHLRITSPTGPAGGVRQAGTRRSDADHGHYA